MLCASANTAFKCRKAFFKNADSWIHNAAVDIAEFLQPRARSMIRVVENI